MTALVDWAHDKSTEEERKKKYDLAGDVNIRDLGNDMLKLASDRKIVNSFEPRKSLGPFIDGEMCINSPEYAVAEFPKYWKQRNYGKMAGHAANLMKEPLNSLAGKIRDMVDFASLTHVEVHSVN